MSVIGLPIKLRTGLSIRKHALQELGRAVAELVDEGVDVEVLCVGPEVEQALAGGEVDARGQQDQVLDVLRVQGGEHRAHRAAHAIAQQAHLLRAAAAADVLDHVAEVAVEVVVQREVAVGVGGRAPVEQIGIEACLDEVRNDALVGQDVEDVGAIDQGEDEQQAAFWYLASPLPG